MATISVSSGKKAVSHFYKGPGPLNSRRLQSDAPFCEPHFPNNRSMKGAPPPASLSLDVGPASHTDGEMALRSAMFIKPL